MSKPESEISIWYFIGILLFVYGLLITGAGVWEWMNPPAKPVALAEMHAGIWWGLLLLVLGGVYLYFFAPRRKAR